MIGGRPGLTEEAKKGNLVREKRGLANIQAGEGNSIRLSE